MVKESKLEYQKQFGENEFYLVIYPSYTEVDPEKYEKFLSYLEKKEIAVIDLRDEIEYGPEYSLNGDPHPNAMTNELLSKTLLERIIKQKTKWIF